MKRFWRNLLIALMMLAAFSSGCTPAGGKGEEEKENRLTAGAQTGETRREAEGQSAAESRNTAEGQATAQGGSEPAKGAEGFSVAIPSLSMEDYPRVDGSTATIPLSHALYRLSTGAGQEEAEKNIIHGKTTFSYLYLMEGTSDIILAYAPSEELMAAIERGEGTYSYMEMEYPVVPLRMEPIGRDALIFLINSANPVDSVSSREIVDIYSGKITNWQEVGGRDSTILAFQRDRESGSQNLMRQLVMQGVPLKEAEESYMLGEMGELIEAVASYDYSADALGYSVYYYASNMKNEPNLRMLGIDGVIPSTETIRSGAYPYINPFYAAIRADEKPGSPAYRLFEWLTSPSGQSLINYMGYVGMEAGDAIESRWMDEQLK